MSDFTKVLAVIRSCKTSAHNAVANLMIANFEANEYRKLRHRDDGHPFGKWYGELRKLSENAQLLRDENDRVLIEICNSK